MHRVPHRLLGLALATGLVLTAGCGGGGGGSSTSPAPTPPPVLAFASRNPAQFYLVRGDGTDLTLLTGAPSLTGYLYGLVWSPGGTRFAFEYYDPDTDRADIYVVDLTAAVPRWIHLTETLDGYAYDPVFSRDGTRLAFQVEFDSSGSYDWTYDVYVVDLTAAVPAPVNLSETLDGEAYDPVFSPDGTRLAFTHYDPDTDREDVYLVDLTDAVPVAVNLTPTLDRYAYAPAFSPDGTRLAFYVEVEKEDGTRYELHTIRPDGTGHVVVSGALEVDPDATYDYVPAWRP